MTALLTALSWGVGVSLGLVVGPAGTLALGGALAAGAAVLLAETRTVRLVALFAVATLLGIARGALGVADAEQGPLSPYLGRVTLVGRVADAPTVHHGRATFALQVVQVVPDAPTAEPIDLSPAALVSVRWAPNIVRAGDVLEVRGRLAEPRSRPGLPLADRLARKGIHHVLTASSARVLDRPGHGLLEALRSVRARLESAIRGAIPDPHASLTAGVVFGARSDLPPALREALTATGTSHIVAVSGFNVVVVAAAMQLVALRLVGRPWSALPSVVGIWTYVLLVGAPPSAVRAGLMASLAVVASVVGRLPDAITTLAVAAAAMLLWDPWLIFDLGFQLSMLATAGLILFATPISARLTVLPTLARGPVAVALATHLVTLPIVLHTFNTLSVVAPLSNLLVGFWIPWLMLLGVLLAVLAWVPGIGDLLGWATWLLASLVLWEIDWAAGLPGAVVFTGRLPLWLALSWYLALALWAAAGSPDIRSLAGRHLATVAAVGAFVLAFAPTAAALAAAPSGPVTVWLLDVPGSSAFIRTADGRSILVSGATSAPPLMTSVAQRLEFWERTVDLAVLARQSDPAVESLAGVLGRYPARHVLAPLPEAGETKVLRNVGSSIPSAPGLEPGQVIALSGGAAIAVVDVRIFQSETVVDLAIELQDSEIWVPGPGRPSPHWVDRRKAGRRTIVRLPGSSAVWLRDLATLRGDTPVGALVVDSPSGVDIGTVPTFSHREHGAIEVGLDGGAIVVRTERCRREADCALVLD